MNTPLLDEIRAHLASISVEQFRTEWAEIEAKNLEGPTMEEFLKSMAYTPVFSPIGHFETVSSQVSDQFTKSSFENTIYAMAA
jgi:hypothetical protein